MTMRKPFFSVVIPTKNRPELLRDAITSVVLQDFEDYEFIVSDNFNDERTKKVVDEFVSDPRLRYFRTEKELNIPDHWEFATLKAKGKYILLLSDRALLRPAALQEIYLMIQNSSQDIPLYTYQHLIFDNKMFYSNTNFLRPTSRASNKVEVFLTRQLLDEYENTGMDYRFPIILNTCYREDLAAEIRRRHGRLFGPICPDGLACFLLLSYTKKLVSLSKPLFIIQGAENSTGVIISLYDLNFYFRTLQLDNNWYHYLPVKVPFKHNGIFLDYLTAKEMVSGKLNLADVNWVAYFLRCYEELIYFSNFSKTGYMRKHKKEFFKEWKRALNSFDKETQTLVKRKARWARILFTIKAFLAKSPFMPFLRKIQNRMEYGYSNNKTYSSALEAAGFSDTDLWLQ